MLLIASGLFLALVVADLLDLTSRRPRGFETPSVSSPSDRIKLGG